MSGRSPGVVSWGPGPSACAEAAGEYEQIKGIDRATAIEVIRSLEIGVFSPGRPMTRCWPSRRSREGTGVSGSLSRRFYFSLNTFTTVGYGDWYPTDERLRLWRFGLPFVRFRTIAMAEGAIGWILITMFVISLGRTWVR